MEENDLFSTFCKQSAGRELLFLLLFRIRMETGSILKVLNIPFE